MRAPTWLLALLVAIPAHIAAADSPAGCPPVAQMPTQAQLQDGVQRFSKDHGVLWRITRDGHTSYLFGTLHIGRFEWAFPGPAMADALRNTDTLALELDPSDPKVNQGIQAAMQDATVMPPLALDAPLQARLQRAYAAACVPAAGMASLHPLMQVSVLSALVARWDGLDVAYAQESVLAGMASALRRPVKSLETPAIQMAAIVPNDPALAHAMLVSGLDELENGRARATAARLAASWEAGNLDDLANYESWCDCAPTEAERAYLREVIDARNPHIADRIAELHAQGKRLFAGVGALHMTGAAALPALLQARGFTVERVVYAAR